MMPARGFASDRQRRARAALVGVAVVVLLFVAGCGPSVDEAFPPGDPTMSEPGDNPVLGSSGPGAIAEADTTNYGLLALLAVCLIAAGVLLVKVESWERRRAERNGTA